MAVENRAGGYTRIVGALSNLFDCSFHSMVFDVCAERLRHTNT